MAGDGGGTGARAPHVEFFFDVACPFAFVASYKVEAAARAAGAAGVEWSPVALGGVYRDVKAPQGTRSASVVMCAAKRAVVGNDLRVMAARAGAPLRGNTRHPVRTLRALRCICAAPPKDRARLSRVLFEAYWRDGRDLGDEAELIRVLTAFDASRAAGLLAASEKEDVKVRCASRACACCARSRPRAFRSPILRARSNLPARTRPGGAARAQRTACRVGRIRSARVCRAAALAWRSGREALVGTRRPAFRGCGLQRARHSRATTTEAVATRTYGQKASVCVLEIFAFESPLAHGCACDKDQHPDENAPPRAHERTNSTLVLYEDVASPFSYLASTAAEALAERCRVRLLRRPVLVGALFREIGTPMVPIAHAGEAKAAYLRREMEAWAAARGVPICVPHPHFPLRTTLAQRVLAGLAHVVEAADEGTAAEQRARARLSAASRALYTAAWARGEDVGQPGVVVAALEAAGFGALGAREVVDKAKVNGGDALRSNTAEAIAAGACGVPTFVVDLVERGGQAANTPASCALVWGQDRMHVVEELLRGWAAPSRLPSARL